MVFFYLMLLFFGVTATPAPDKVDHPKVLAIVKQLGSDEYKIREKASLDLFKMVKSGKANVHFIELVSNGKINDPETKDLYDLETRRRCRWIVRDVLWVTSDAKKMPWPGIWHIHNTIRFPMGFTRSYDKGWDSVKRYANKYDTWYASVDISEKYYIQARKRYNYEQKSMSKWFEEVKDTVWRHTEIEQLATRMLAEDLLRAGMPKREIERLLNQMLYWNFALVIPNTSGYNNQAQTWLYPKPPPHPDED